MRRLRRVLCGTGAVLALVAVGGCSSLTDRPLPFAAGNGSGAITVEVVMADAGQLVPNSEVKVGDVTVGSVRHISFQHWDAVLEVGLDKGVDLPANATATVGQKSLLGAEYLQLAPPTTAAATGHLRDGMTIPLAHTGRYPETEEVLAALSAVLNGGGLAQAQTITTELNQALHGREGTVRDLITQAGDLAGTLDRQRNHIVDALAQLNRTVAGFRGQQATVSRALTALPQAVSVANRDEHSLVGLLSGMQRFSKVATRLETASKADIVANLASLKPVMTQLAAAKKSLTGFLANPLISFPTDGLLRSVKGDYMNLFLTVDLTTTALSRDWLTGTPLAGLGAALNDVLPSTAPSSGAGAGTNPLSSLLGPLLGASASPSAQGSTAKHGGTSGTKGTKTKKGKHAAPSASASSTPSCGGLLGGLLGC